MSDIWFFGVQGQPSGDAEMVDLLGGKGAFLADMSERGFPVPPGFTLTTELCKQYNSFTDLEHRNEWMEDLLEMHVFPALACLEDMYGFVPLLSVRSGARVSMPGMMDTILNVGLTAESLPQWEKMLGRRTALDSRRRLMEMYGETVYQIPRDEWAWQFEIVKKAKHNLPEPPKTDEEMTEVHMEKVVDRYQKYVLDKHHIEFPEILEEQIQGAIEAVFQSWNSDRARYYRQMNGYPDDWGTACNVQAMVFGNMNEKSGSGVMFTRNPDDGASGYVGEFLPVAQGEDVVAGTRTPLSLSKLPEWNPEIADQLSMWATKAEYEYKDMQDMEFTIENGKLWILQTRSGKRSGRAAFKIALEMASEKIITREEALSRVNGKDYQNLKIAHIAEGFNEPPHATGIGAAGGVIKGKAVFTSEEAVQTPGSILVRTETTPDDIQGMDASDGILTATGGETSHAAVVARSMGKACVVGVTSMKVENGQAVLENGTHFGHGATITIDGKTGNVWVGIDVPVQVVGTTVEAETLLGWGIELKYGDKKPLMKQTPENADEVVFDTSTWVNIHKLDTLAIKDFLAAVTTSVAKTVFVDLAGRHQVKLESDADLWNAFGKDEQKLDKLLLERAEVFSGAFSKQVIDRVVLVLPKELPDVEREDLAKCGWNIAQQITTLKQLLNSGGYGEITPQLHKTVGNDELETLLDIMKKGGQTLEALPEAVSKEKLVFEILGH